MSRKIYVILMIVYKLSLELLFIYNLSSIYDYLGVRLDYSGYKMFISWVVFFILIMLTLNFEKHSFWFIVIQLFSLFVIVPSISLYGLKNLHTTYFIYNLIFWLFFIIYAIFLSKIKFTSTSFINIAQKININDTVLTIIFIVSAISVLVASYLYGDFRVMIDFNDIYKYRLELREVSMPVYFRYMLPFMGTISLPLCVMEYLNRKKYIFLGLTLLVGLMLFSINGMKTWLFVYFVVFAVYNVTKKEYNNYSIINRILTLFIIGSIVGYIFSVYYKNNVISGNIHRMTIAVPEISYYFIDYFIDKEPLLLRGSILRHLLQYPYSIPIEFQIGGLYMGNFANRANNGLLGDAYSNFKFFGVISYPFLYTLVFKILQIVLHRYDYKTNYFMLFVLIWASMNTSFFTWLLTGGVIMVCFIYYFNSKFCEKSRNH